MKLMKKALCALLACMFVFAAALPVFAADDCEHEYIVTVVQATCTADGYALHLCTKCGDSYQDEIVPAHGHKYGYWTATQKATCQQNGIWERTCVYCQTKETKTTPVLDHTDVNADGKCNMCGTDVPFNDVYSPFQWFVDFFTAIKNFFVRLFSSF